MLTKEQVNHYLRHIIIPQIGEKGQKKLLDSSALIYCENTESLRIAAYYLSASGTGKIYCYLENKEGHERLFDEITDLNKDTEVSLYEESNAASNEASYRIVTGSMIFVKQITSQLSKNKFIPTIISISSSWKGSLQTFTNSENLKEFIQSLNKVNYENSLESPNFFANDFSAILSVIEGIKIVLNLGVQKNKLFYNLLSMEFTETANIFEKLIDNSFDAPDPLPKLSQEKILIVGAGGLGSPAAYALTKAGIKTLGLLDLDFVEMSNLNRQVLHSFSRIGIAKVESAKYLLKKIKPEINIKTHQVELTESNAAEIISQYSLVIAAVDNIESRYLINDSCFKLNIPVCEAGILDFHGTATTIIPKEGHCYRCLYPKINTAALSNLPQGVLGPIPGIMGYIEAAEAVKVLTKVGNTLKNKIILFDSLDMDFNIIQVKTYPQCPTCGKL